jgi:hypothetical protein
MATTTNYSWTTPDDTALVKDGAAAIRSLGTAIDTTVFANAGAAIAKSIVDAKGDLIAGTADNTVARLAVGANDTILVADSSTATGLKWAAPAGGGKVLQVVGASTTQYTARSVNTYVDTGLTASITPSSASSKVLVLVNINEIFKQSGVSAASIKLFRGATEIAFSKNIGYDGTSTEFRGLSYGVSILDTPATTSSTTYKTQFCNEQNTGTVSIGGDSQSTIILLEIGA